MTKSTEKTRSRLLDVLVRDIVDIARREQLSLGGRLNEKQLAARLNVSRTPVRAALQALEDQGVVKRTPQIGFVLITDPSDVKIQDAQAYNDDQLLAWIARDRDNGRLSPDVSVVELAELYERPRPTVKHALERLSELGVVQRKPGYGWSFISDWNASVRDESYRYRLVMEPAAILEPAFQLPAGWADSMRQRHEITLTQPWTEASSIAFFETNAEFHEGIAAASGNRFFKEAMRAQNRIRRLSLYHWRHGFDRVQVNYSEHMQILDELENRNFAKAAELMRRHLESARAIGKSP